jgi:hypothetical protein
MDGTCSMRVTRYTCKTGKDVKDITAECTDKFIYLFIYLLVVWLIVSSLNQFSFPVSLLTIVRALRS